MSGIMNDEKKEYEPPELHETIKNVVDECFDERMGEIEKTGTGDVKTIQYRLDRLDKSIDDFHTKAEGLEREMAQLRGTAIVVSVFLGLITTLFVLLLSRGLKV